MIYLKITKTEEGLAILLNDEAREMLGVVEGGEIGLEVSDNGDVVLAAQDMSRQARRQRGRAFIQRYQKTFEALAK